MQGNHNIALARVAAGLRPGEPDKMPPFPVSWIAEQLTGIPPVPERERLIATLLERGWWLTPFLLMDGGMPGETAEWMVEVFRVTPSIRLSFMIKVGYGCKMETRRDNNSDSESKIKHIRKICTMRWKTADRWWTMRPDHTSRGKRGLLRKAWPHIEIGQIVATDGRILPPATDIVFGGVFQPYRPRAADRGRHF